MTSPTHHLLTLGNPSHAADAMDEPFAVLLDWAGRWGDAEGAPDWRGSHGEAKSMRTLVRGNSNGIGANPGSGKAELPKGGAG
jgi:hypothetical protein